MKDSICCTRTGQKARLGNAEDAALPKWDACVIGAEGLIAFKLQGYFNDPVRHRDLDDIRALLQANRATLDMLYGATLPFAREPLLDELLADLDR